MLNRYRKLVVLLLCLMFTPVLFCSVLNINLRDIPATLRALAKTEIEIQRAVARARAKYSADDVHHLACLAVFGLTEDSKKIESHIAKAHAELSERLSEKASRELVPEIQAACRELLETINLAAHIIQSKLHRIKAPSRHPEIEYPDKVISLGSIIDLFTAALKTAWYDSDVSDEEYSSAASDAGAGTGYPAASATLCYRPSGRIAQIMERRAQIHAARRAKLEFITGRITIASASGGAGRAGVGPKRIAMTRANLARALGT